MHFSCYFLIRFNSDSQNYWYSSAWSTHGKKVGGNFVAQNPPVGAFQNKNPPQIFGQQFVNKPPVINGHEQIRTGTTIRVQIAKVLIFQYEQTPTDTNRQGDL